MSPAVIVLMLTTSLFAGWVDAVVGGGGLILLPFIMILNPSFTYSQALGVNKIAATAAPAAPRSPWLGASRPHGPLSVTLPWRS